jgi:hypothetical protein
MVAPAGRGCGRLRRRALGRNNTASPLWTLQRLRFGPDVAADTSDRGENRDPDAANREKQEAIDKGSAIRERPRECKGDFGLTAPRSGRSCVRPQCAVRIPAGPDEIRSPAPNQGIALCGALTRTGLAGPRY